MAAFQAAFAKSSAPRLERITPVKERDFTKQKFSGGDINEITGFTDRGVAYEKYKLFLARKLNDVKESKDAKGFLIDQQQQKYLLTPAGVKRVADKLAELDLVLNPNATQRKEAREYREELEKHHRQMTSLDAASGMAIKLIEDTSTSYVNNMLSTAAIGNETKPWITLNKFLVAAQQDFMGEPSAIKQSVIGELTVVGFAKNNKDVNELLNQITKIMTTAHTLIMTTNPAVNEVALQEAEQIHGAAVARINLQNASLPGDLQIAQLPPFQRPPEFIPRDPTTTLPTTKEIAEIAKDRIDSNAPSLIAIRGIIDSGVTRNEPWKQISATISTYISNDQPSINVRQQKVAAAQAATVFQTAMASHQPRSYASHEQPDLTDYDHIDIDQSEQQYDDDQDYEQQHPQQAAAASSYQQHNKRPRTTDTRGQIKQPSVCIYWDGRAKECHREQITGLKCPVAKFGHFGSERRQQDWINVFPPVHSGGFVPAQGQDNQRIRQLEQEVAMLRAGARRSSGFSSRSASAAREDEHQG